MSQAEAKDFFETYLAAWNGQDLEALSRLYDEPSTFILPDRSLPLADRAATVALMELVFQGLNADGFAASRYADLEARACGEGLAVLDVSAVERVRHDGSVIETIDAHYILRRQADASWRITAAVVCAPGWRRP